MQRAASAAPHLVALDAAACRALLHDDAPPASLQQAIARSLDYLAKMPADRMLPALDRRISVAELRSMLNSITQATDWPQEICTHFRLHRVELLEPLLVTGYYQPELAVRRTRTERFRYPLYRIPDDLVDVDLSQWALSDGDRVIHGRVQDGKLVPYYSRAEIDAGALEGRGYEIAWLDDPVEAFFLHVQGSGLLHFDDGVQMQVSYSGSNGQPYTSIGRMLVEQGKLSPDAVSLQALKDYLRAHPDEQAALIAANQRYIFFRPVITGPIGSLGVPLTAGRSIAADASVYARGGLAFTWVFPRDGPQATSTQPILSRFVLIQDAGAAVTGSGRIDVFFGTGATAEAVAGDMRNPGEFYLILPQ